MRCLPIRECLAFSLYTLLSTYTALTDCWSSRRRRPKHTTKSCPEGRGEQSPLGLLQRQRYRLTLIRRPNCRKNWKQCDVCGAAVLSQTRKNQRWLMCYGHLVLLGIEKVRIVPGFTATNPLDLYYHALHPQPHRVLRLGGGRRYCLLSVSQGRFVVDQAPSVSVSGRRTAGAKDSRLS